MKRYAITIALVLLIATSLGTYYSFGADLHVPEYRLQTIEGDPAEAAEVTLFGTFAGGNSSVSIEVSTMGSKRSEPSLWSRWQESDGPLSTINSEFHSLYQEHSGFMRGKTAPSGFYQDRDTLIYAKAKNSLQDGTVRWTVDTLDLASGKQTRYEDEQIEPANDVYVVDVRKIGSEVHVMTNVNSKMIDKVFDTVSGDPIRSVRLSLGEPSGSDPMFPIEIIDAATAATPRVLFIVREQIQDSSDAGAMADGQPLATYSEHLYVYLYASGEVKEVPLAPSVNKDGTWSRHFLEGDTFTSLHKSNEAVTIDRYDLSTDQSHPQLTITADQLGKGEIGQAQIANGRVYLLLRTDDTLEHNSMPITAVADAADGHILYKGTPALVKSNGRPDDQLNNIWLMNMMIRP